MQFGSLFAGIGGMDLGLERAGMECAFQVEIDEYATKVLERHWPDIRRWRDIRDFIADAEKHGVEGRSRSRKERSQRRVSDRSSSYEVDLICGGFPCQPFSVAGSRKGDSDERYLWPLFRECIRIIRPRWVLIENVPGLISIDAGRIFRSLLWDLAQLRYDAEWQIIPAAAFGAPHLRKRVFIISYTNKECEQGLSKRKEKGVSIFGISGQPSTDANKQGSQKRQGEPGHDGEECTSVIGDDWRFAQPTICKSDHGPACGLVRNRTSMLRCLGNAVVPQVAEWIGRRIMELEEC